MEAKPSYRYRRKACLYVCIYILISYKYMYSNRMVRASYVDRKKRVGRSRGKYDIRQVLLDSVKKTVF